MSVLATAAARQVRRRVRVAPRREMTSGAPDWYDVTVVGGGPVGATVAAALATAGAARRMRVAILDAAPPRPPLPEPGGVGRWTLESPPEARAYALSPTSVEILQAIGVWGDVVARPIGRYEHMQVWDELGGGYVRLGGAGVDLGCIVEDSLLSGALWQRLDQLSQQRQGDEHAGCLDLIRPAKVVSTVFPTDEGARPWPQLELDDGRRFETRLLVDATGGFSPIRDQAAFRTVGVDYNQRGVVATVALADVGAHNATAWQRFLPTGPIALLPMGPGVHTFPLPFSSAYKTVKSLWCRFRECGVVDEHQACHALARAGRRAVRRRRHGGIHSSATCRCARQLGWSDLGATARCGPNGAKLPTALVPPSI